jgi:hypothetical protein
MSNEVHNQKISVIGNHPVNFPLYSNIRIFINDIPITFKEFLHNTSQGNFEILDYITNTIINYHTDALFFETPSIMVSTYETDIFEYMLIPSTELQNIVPDYGPFEEKFKRSCKNNVDINGDSDSNSDHCVVSFGNLSGDSMLVAPCPIHDQNNKDVIDFSHLKRFTVNADINLIHKIWQRVAKEAITILQNNSNQRLWISTSGLGVSWLHIRLDSTPKYYNWLPYK